MRLTDEEIRGIRFQASCSEGYPLNLSEYGIKELIEKVADAQIAKCQSYYASLGEEELKREVLFILRTYNLPAASVSENTGADRARRLFIDQIISLIMGWKEATNGHD